MIIGCRPCYSTVEFPRMSVIHTGVGLPGLYQGGIMPDQGMSNNKNVAFRLIFLVTVTQHSGMFIICPSSV